MKQTIDDLRLDGNAAAGLLGQLFAFEITSATTVCDGCGRASLVGALPLYRHQMGAVLRCPACDQVLLVVTRPHDEWWLDLRGMRITRIAVLAAPPAPGTAPRSGSSTREHAEPADAPQAGPSIRTVRQGVSPLDGLKLKG